MSRDTQRRLFVLGLAVLAAVSASCPAEAADLDEVSVPATTQWCLVRPAAIADLSDPSFQQAEIDQVMLTVGKAGARIGTAEFGVPSVDRVDRLDDRNVRITYCANIDASKPPPAGAQISARKRPMLKVVGKACDGDSIDACEDVLRTAIEGAPWNIPHDVAMDLAHFVSSVAMAGSLNERVVAAVNNAHSHLYDPNIGLVIVKPVTGPQTTILALGLP